MFFIIYLALSKGENYKVSIQYKFRKDLYSKEALIKAAYNFIDDFYIHLDSDNNYYIVAIDAREKNSDYQTIKEFQNEMLIQETRKIVNDKTINIREIMYSRAMASTVIDENNQEDIVENENADKILVDWFEENE